MAVESTNSIAGLDATKPTGNDPKAEGDDHLRLLKSVLQHVFGGFGGEVLVAATEAQGATANDFVLALTPAPAAYAGNTVAIFAATHANTGAATIKLNALAAVSLLNPEGTALRPNAITAGCWVAAVCDGTNFRILAGGNSKAIYDYVDQAAFQSSLPGQASQGGKFLATDGTNANWKSALPLYSVAPGANEGAVYITGTGPMEWNGTAYVPSISKASVGLGNVDNTSDAGKPISTAAQTALNAKMNVTGGIFTGAVTVQGNLVSTGTVFAGNGASYLAGNGDVNGSAWGGLLSTYMTNNVFAQINTKINIRAGFGGSGYVLNGTSNTLSMAWNGSNVLVGVDSSSLGSMWTSTNFNPATKKDAGNYVKDFSGSERVGLSWSGTQLIAWIDGIGRFVLQVVPI